MKNTREDEFGAQRWQVLLWPSLRWGKGVYPEGSDKKGKIPLYRWWRFGPVSVRRYPTTAEIRAAYASRA